MPPALSTLLTAVALSSTAAATQNTYDLQISYLATIVPLLPDPLGGPGCGLWAQITVAGAEQPRGTSASWAARRRRNECPAADRALSCGRWGGCPYTMAFEQVVHVTVLSENGGGDKASDLRAAALGTGEVDVACPWDPADVRRTDSMQVYQAWRYTIVI
ncbi:hypothetical protein INS49_003363 [Diaporthe citri]|uniref:uncharacterized protein n=1 Tax=Diaporthe citri TaxID=83186 RepID=UPI001C81C13E|nr:uncharacterized protein INS49_003363 [Diaporthe citri]KAG6355401.1 hypothetical protein INS49_003363 [Diaporthe citri]